MFYLMISILLPFCGGIFEGPGYVGNDHPIPARQVEKRSAGPQVPHLSGARDGVCSQNMFLLICM